MSEEKKEHHEDGCCAPKKDDCCSSASCCKLKNLVVAGLIGGLIFLLGMYFGRSQCSMGKMCPINNRAGTIR